MKIKIIQNFIFQFIIQGNTLEKGKVNLAKTRSTFVQLSRFKKITDFLI